MADYLSALKLGSQVTNITGKSADGFTAGGFASFMQSISNESPTLVPLSKNRVQLVLSRNQIAALQNFLDIQLKSSLKKRANTLDIAIGPAVMPWLLKYAAPAAISLVLAGWFAHYYFGGR